MVRNIVLIDDRGPDGQRSEAARGLKDRAHGWGMDLFACSTDVLGIRAVQRFGFENCIVVIGVPAFFEDAFHHSPSDGKTALAQHIIELGVPESRVIVVAKENATELETRVGKAVAATLSCA